MKTIFIILIMYLFGPGGVFGHNPPLIYSLFGLYMEHEDWYPKLVKPTYEPVSKPVETGDIRRNDD